MARTGKLRRFLDRVEPLFNRGGALERYGAVFEMVDTFLYTPADVTAGAPHVRDAIDLKRLMIAVVLAATPCFLMAMYMVGHETNAALATLGLDAAEGWRGAIIERLGIGFNADSIWACLAHGALYVLPIYIVTLVAGGFWEVLFALVRNHEINEGFLVTSLLFALTLPASMPLWQVALGISFGVVIGKEVFGGTGKNFLNPALVGRAFLFFAYPAQMSGDCRVGAGGRLQRRHRACPSPPPAASKPSERRHDLAGCLPGHHPGLDRRDLDPGLPARRCVPDLDPDRLLADHGRGIAGHGGHDAAVQPASAATPTHVRPALVLAPGAGRVSPSAWCSWPPTR